MHKLEIKNITQSYRGIDTVRDISLYVDEGELVCLLGQSGVGKSTLFNIVAGLLPPDSGEVIINGEPATGTVGLAGYMQQKDLLLPHKKVIDNIILPLIIRGVPKKEAVDTARRHADIFNIGDLNKYPSELSGGQRQRAALLRTYLFGSDLLLLDEPFSALDTVTRHSMHRWFGEVMAQYRWSSLLVTHDIDEAVMLADRIYVMTHSTSAAPVGTTAPVRAGVISAEMKIDRPEAAPDADFSETYEFIDYKKAVMKALAER